MQRALSFAAMVLCLLSLSAIGNAQSTPFVTVDFPASSMDFAIVAGGKAAPIYVAPGNPETVTIAAQAFASDVERVTGVKPEVLASLPSPLPANLILVGVYGQSPEID